MVKQWHKGKLLKAATIAVALLSVAVAGVSTYAWFQLEKAPIESNLVSGSPDLNIESVTGHKVEHTIGAYGQDIYDPELIATRESNGTGLSIQSTDNDDLEGENINYDIPDLGIGYYLVWPNANGLLKYTRTYDGSGNVTGRNYVKFQKMQYGTKYYASITVSQANTECKIKKYTFENSTTINKQVKVNSAWPTHEIEEQDNGDVLIKITGTYSIWIDSNDFSQSGTPTTYSVSNVYAQQTTSEEKTTSADTPLLPKGLIRKELGVPVSPSSGNKTIYITDQAGWNAINTWMKIWYIGTSNSGSWPGTNSVSWNECYTNEDGNKVYSIQVPSAATGVVLTNNGGTEQTGNITFATYNAIWFGGWTSYGQWTLTTETYYFYDLYNGAQLWTTPYAYTWTTKKSDGTNYTAQTFGSSAIAMTNEGNGFWSFTVPSYGYRKIIFSTNSSMNSYKSEDLLCRDVGAGTNNSGKCWYPNKNTGNSYYYGTWATNGLSTYYLYDPNFWFASGSPKAYCWSPNGGYSSYYSAWPGTAMTNNQSVFENDEPDIPSRIFEITVPAGYTQMIFINNSGTKQTVDLTLTNYANKVFVLLKQGESSSYVTGEWVNGLDCFYLDTSSGINWDGVKMLDSGGNIIIDSLSNFQIAPNFYKIYWTKNYIVKFRNAGNNTNDKFNLSGAFDLNTRTSNYLYIGTSFYNNECRETLSAAPNGNASNIGVATIKISTDGGTTWKDPITNSTSVFSTTMSVGDVTKDNYDFSNYFIYEMGLEIPYGALVQVVVSDSAASDYDNTFVSKIRKTYNGSSTCSSTYGGTGPNAGSTIQYLNVTASTITIKKPTGAVGNSARFNFYIFNDKSDSNNGKLSITMIPKKGNGYYIMDYGTISGNTTEGFVDAVKMSSTSNNYATYNGFYAKDGDQIYIRKYIDTVDELCPTITINGASAHHVTDSIASAKGVIEFDSDDYYLIEVNGTSVTISTYTHDNFFQLGPIDTSDVASQSAISNQYTSLVLDVKFTVNTANSFDLGLALQVTIPESLRPYVGVQFYYNGTTGTGDTNPYIYMRYYRENLLKDYDSLANLPTYTITASQSGESELHAYILIDYIPGSLASLPGYLTDTLSFKLVTSYENS